VQKKQHKRIPGFRGPFEYPNGRVLYQDRQTEEYYDPSTDFFVSTDEVEYLKNQMLDLVR